MNIYRNIFPGIKNSLVFVSKISLFIFWFVSFSVPGQGAQMFDDTNIMPKPFSIEDFKIQSTPEDSSKIVIPMAIERFKQGQFKQALEYATLFLSKTPDNIQAHGIIGVIYAFTAQKEMAGKELAFLKPHPEGLFFSELINAMLKAQEGDLQKAETHLSAALKQEPGHPVALYYKGSLFLAQNQYQSAITHFETVLKSYPEFVPALAGLGQAHLLTKDKEKASSYYEKAIQLDPENLIHRQQLLKIYQETGKKELAETQMKEMLYYTPGVKEEYLKKGNGLLIIGAFEEAITLMDRMITVYKDIPLAFYIKAVAHSNLKETDKAVKNLQKFLDVQKNMPMTHHFAGMCYLALGMHEKAEQQFLKVISLNPNMGKSFVPLTIIEQLKKNFPRALEGLTLARKGGEPDTLVDFLSAHIFLQMKNDPDYFKKMENGVKLIPGLKHSALSAEEDKNKDFLAENRNLMVLFFYNGWYDKTLKISEALIEKNPQDRFAVYYKALSETAQGKNKEGIQSFTALLKLEKDLFSAYMGMGQLYLKTNEAKNATIVFQHVIDINPSYAPGFAALGDAFQADLNYEQAIYNYKKALELNPQMTAIYSKLINLLVEQKETLQQAEQYAEKLETLSPKDPYSLDAMGWVNLNLKNTQKGMDLIQAAYKAAPQDPIILYHLGMAHYYSKDHKSSEKYLKAAVANAKNFPGYDQAMRILKEIKSE